MKKIILLSMLIVLLSGCNNGSSNNKCVTVKKFQSTVLNLYGRIASLKARLVLLQQQQFDITYQLLSMRDSGASFSPGDSGGGYQVVKTNVGHFIVSLDKLYKYADGYKVRFRVGNPSFATVTRYNATIQWGRACEKGESYVKWRQSLHTRQLRLTKPIYPGRWNNIDFILSPAKSSQTGYISLSINVDGISLSRDFRK